MENKIFKERSKTCLRLDRKLHNYLKFLAFEHQKTVNALIEQAVREFLIKHNSDGVFGRLEKEWGKLK